MDLVGFWQFKVHWDCAFGIPPVYSCRRHMQVPHLPYVVYLQGAAHMHRISEHGIIRDLCSADVLIKRSHDIFRFFFFSVVAELFFNVETPCFLIILIPLIIVIPLILIIGGLMLVSFCITHSLFC